MMSLYFSLFSSLLLLFRSVLFCSLILTRGRTRRTKALLLISLSFLPTFLSWEAKVFLFCIPAVLGLSSDSFFPLSLSFSLLSLISVVGCCDGGGGDDDDG